MAYKIKAQTAQRRLKVEGFVLYLPSTLVRVFYPLSPLTYSLHILTKGITT